MVFRVNNVTRQIPDEEEGYDYLSLANEVAHTMTILIKYIKSVSDELHYGGVGYDKSKLKF